MGDNGGPAFPSLKSFNQNRNAGQNYLGYSAQSEGGMTLRDYFAAHAPLKPASWFKPIGVTFPSYYEEGPALPHGKTERTPRGTSAAVGHCDECRAYYEACKAFEDERARRRSEYEMAIYVQWPWAYADAMLAARAALASAQDSEG